MPLSRARLASGMGIAAALLGSPCVADEPTKQACVDANENAQDLQRDGKLMDARGQLRICAARMCPRVVREDCAERLATVEKALPSVVLTPIDAAGEGESATVSVDGVARPEAVGTPIPMDPGGHTLTVRLPGRLPVSLRVTLREGEHVEKEVVFKIAASPAPKTEAEEMSRSAEGVSPAAPAWGAAPDNRSRRLRWLGWSALGAGAAGIALGSFFGVRALGDHSSLESECSNFVCRANAESDIDRLHLNSSAADICFAVGVLGLGAGAALLIFVPQSTPAADPVAGLSAFRASPWVGVGDVGVSGVFR